MEKTKKVVKKLILLDYNIISDGGNGISFGHHIWKPRDIDDVLSKCNEKGQFRDERFLIEKDEIGKIERIHYTEKSINYYKKMYRQDCKDFSFPVPYAEIDPDKPFEYLDIDEKSTQISYKEFLAIGKPRRIAVTYLENKEIEEKRRISITYRETIERLGL